MAKLKALLLTEGYHGMISQVEGLAKALGTEFHHKIVRLNWPWNYIPPKLTPKSEIILKDKKYLSEDNMSATCNVIPYFETYRSFLELMLSGICVCNWFFVLSLILTHGISASR